MRSPVPSIIMERKHSNSSSSSGSTYSARASAIFSVRAPSFIPDHMEKSYASKHSTGSSGASTSHRLGRRTKPTTGRIIKVLDTGKAFRFPLHSRKNLPVLNLPPRVIETFQTNALDQLRQASSNDHIWAKDPTRASPVPRGYQWKKLTDKKTNITVHRLKSKVSPFEEMRIRCSVRTDMKRLAWGINADTTDTLRCSLAHLFESSFLDAAVLQVHQAPTDESPFDFCMVKWMALQWTVDANVSTRIEIVYLDVCQKIVSPRGRTIIARSMTSIDLDDYPTCTPTPFKFAKPDLKYLQLFTPTDKTHVLDSTIKMSLHFRGDAVHTPNWLGDRIESAFAMYASRLGTASDARYIMAKEYITDRPFKAPNSRPVCKVCLLAFVRLRPRHNCSACADLMCQSCSVDLGIQTHLLPESKRPLPSRHGNTDVAVREKFCVQCIQDFRIKLLTQGMPELPKLESLSMLSSEQSFSSSSDSCEPFIVESNASLSIDSNCQPQKKCRVPSATTHSTVASTTSIYSDVDSIQYETQSTTTSFASPDVSSTTPDEELATFHLSQSMAMRYRNLKSTSDEWSRPENHTVLYEQSSDKENFMPSSFIRVQEALSAQERLLRRMMAQKTRAHLNTDIETIDD